MLIWHLFYKTQILIWHLEQPHQLVQIFCLFCKKKPTFLFYTFTFTKHPHQFIYSTHLFNKIFILFTFFIISFPLLSGTNSPPCLLHPHPHLASNPSTKSGYWFTDLPQQQNLATDSPIFHNNNHNNDTITITTTLTHSPSMFDQFSVTVYVSKQIVGSERLIGVPNSFAAQTRQSNSICGARDLRRVDFLEPLAPSTERISLSRAPLKMSLSSVFVRVKKLSSTSGSGILRREISDDKLIFRRTLTL